MRGVHLADYQFFCLYYTLVTDDNVVLLTVPSMGGINRIGFHRLTLRMAALSIRSRIVHAMVTK